MKVSVWLVVLLKSQLSLALLYPRDSESRETKSLDGRWNFVASPKFDQQIGFKEKWYTKNLRKIRPDDVIDMAVPSSFNDITEDRNLRDYVGVVWYQREFWVPKRWKGLPQRVFLRFGSAHYCATVWLNGVHATQHCVGHLPFEVDVTDLLKYTGVNSLTVALNNTLTHETIPQGTIVHHNNTKKYPPGYFIQELQFDFFNYAGLHRPVLLYTTPTNYIEDVTVKTIEIVETDAGTPQSAKLSYLVDVGGKKVKDSNLIYVQLEDTYGVVVAQAKGEQGNLTVTNPNLWWPLFMHDHPGYLYTLTVHLTSQDGSDVYRLPVGIRSVHWDTKGVFINNRPFYFRGFGKHEDADIRGKGFDWPLVLKDFNLLEWVGANSFRTSHYPYAEEIMQEADRRGIVVIDECPAVGLSSFTEEMRQLHSHIMKELISRDKNHPSVVMWSIANEPHSSQSGAKPYFKEVVNDTKALDSSRPITAALAQPWDSEQAAEYLDVVMVNRYFSWYEDTGHTELIQRQLVSEFDDWRQRFNKPIMMSEYGADTIIGLHTDPVFIFTEDYQSEVLRQHFKGFKVLRDKGWFTGEHVWNFADFMTDQTINRVVGNKKGIFTRNRQPKAAARVLRCHYLMLATEWDKNLSNTTLPDECRCHG